ncbi:helix-turn-helix transcriptional regulator [Cellvibrio japonicus]|uniref:helix-turn-helix transcriptional regulator n=1 Tax=Cellvibrio japonicus TaxID=155077 RepID=UPI0011D0B99F|nr:helix-turn-helix transcriptional regulator [Cellvibrio japonicus]QEI11910.1 helix-turn-helix transcriptional regulator [Cellvibrio japonicus]QEI15484.1 helix-turn-helix transcriptional regulator [Cellvibrio japonicus]QEI19063.1 helix-turn-helix transcriptional regulator [Cellvibrio japonicus]
MGTSLSEKRHGLLMTGIEQEAGQYLRLFSRFQVGQECCKNPQQWQIAEALRRLGRGESIACIFDALGYANPSAFSAMFKRSAQPIPESPPHRPIGTNVGIGDIA